MPTNNPDVTQKLKRTFWPTEYFSMDTKHFTAKNDPRRKQSTISRIVKKDKNKSAETNLYKLQELFIIL